MKPSATELSAQLAAVLGDDFLVERTLGTGGFGSVLLVTERRLQRRLAVKVLAPDVLASPSAVERFEREATTVAQLSHPHIVPLHFVGGGADFRFLAMGYVDGGTAADRVASHGPWVPEDVRRLLREVADALAYAHRRGVIHRDIKAANVLLDRESGRAMLTDFGIARTMDVGLTATGIVVGTPAYLSPEQVAGEAATTASDIYALGLLAYELLTGRLPFQGATATAVMYQRIAQPAPSVREHGRDVPAPLAELVMHCLEREPTQRPASAAVIVQRLDAMMLASTSTVPPVVRPSRRSWWIGASVAMAGAAVGTLWFVRSPTDDATSATTNETLLAAPTAASVVQRDARIQSWWRIPAGRVRVGNDADTSSPPRLSSRPAHDEEISALRLAPRPATTGDVARFAATGRMRIDSLRRDSSDVAQGLTFAEASAFCAWLVPGGRLPTEAEWETAARVHGDAMLGRGWEWTSSVVRAYPGAAPLQTDAERFRVIRGGAPETPPALLLPSLRGYADINATRRDVSRTGVRCAVDDAQP